MTRHTIAQGSARESASDTAPHGAITETLRLIWRDVLELPDTPADGDFLDLGGDSLSAMRAISRISEELDAHLTLADFFEHQTLHEMAQHIADVRRASARDPA